MASESNRLPTISMNTGVTVSAVVAIAGVLWSAWSNNASLRDELRTGLQTTQDQTRAALQSTRDDVRDVKEDVRSLRTDIQARTDDRWKRSEMKVWALKLEQVLAPTLPSGVRLPPVD